ncbi:MAG: rhodanese-like domain-containing protein, partial [Desulfovibrionaceae bacterium]
MPLPLSCFTTLRVRRLSPAPAPIPALALALMSALALTLALAAPARAQGDFPLRNLYPEVPIVTTAQLAADYDRTIVVDIRSQFEFDVAHVAKALLLPLSREDFGEALEQIRPKRSDLPMAFYCNGYTCAKSYMAAQLALALGFTNVYAYDAGIFDWINAAPERATLMGATPANRDSVIPEGEFLDRTLSYAEFKARGLAERAVFIDIRDPFQRTDAPDLPGLRNIPLDPLLELVTNRVWTERPLYFVDAVGKQVQWLQYFLKAYGYFDYAFLRGGVAALAPADLTPVQGSSGALHVYQAALDQAVADHRIHEPDLSLLVFILGRIQFNNYAALRTDDLRQAVSGDRAALAAALNRLAAANYLIYRRAEDNIILQINPNLAWKGD